jgi:hypothetical protein
MSARGCQRLRKPPHPQPTPASRGPHPERTPWRSASTQRGGRASMAAGRPGRPRQTHEGSWDRHTPGDAVRDCLVEPHFRCEPPPATCVLQPSCLFPGIGVVRRDRDRELGQDSLDQAGFVVGVHVGSADEGLIEEKTRLHAGAPRRVLAPRRTRPLRYSSSPCHPPCSPRPP